MIRSNYMTLVFSLLGCSLIAMDKNNNNKPLLNGQHCNIQESENERQRKEKLEFERKREIHKESMDLESYLQRYGTPEEYFMFKYGHRIFS